MKYLVIVLVIAGLIFAVYLYSKQSTKKAQIAADQANFSNILTYNQNQLASISNHGNTFSQVLTALGVVL